MSALILWIAMLCPSGYVSADRECWREIRTEPYLDLTDGAIKEYHLSEGSTLEPKGDACPSGYYYEEYSSTTFVYQHCVKQ